MFGIHHHFELQYSCILNRKDKTKHNRPEYRSIFSVFGTFCTLLAAGLFISSCSSSRHLKNEYALSPTDYDGIDVSHYNGTIDWKAVSRNKNIKYVYVKATQGSGYLDPCYVSNVEGARRAGLKVGIYHYFTSRSSATAQFQWFRSQAIKTEQDLIPMVDVEEMKGWRDRLELQDSLMAFAHLVKKFYGTAPLLYTSQNFYNANLSPRFGKFWLFIAAYRKTEPSINGAAWNLWQFTDTGRVKGITGFTDLSKLSKKTKIKKLYLK